MPRPYPQRESPTAGESGRGPRLDTPLVVHAQYATARRGIPGAGTLHRAARAAWRGPGAGEVSLRIVDEDEGHALNRQFRGGSAATNVLSFPSGARENEALPAYLGDIVLCAPVLAREALEQNKPLRAHYVHMVVHGMLHLQEFDHQTEAQAERMESLERQILAGLGYPDPYRETEEVVN